MIQWVSSEYLWNHTIKGREGASEDLQLSFFGIFLHLTEWDKDDETLVFQRETDKLSF